MLIFETLCNAVASSAVSPYGISGARSPASGGGEERGERRSEARRELGIEAREKGRVLFCTVPAPLIHYCRANNSPEYPGPTTGPVGDTTCPD